VPSRSSPTPRPPTAADDPLRPAVELAWLLARGGEVDPPRELRPLLRFAKLPPRGAAVIRRLLETDADFRAAVAARVVHAGDEADFPRPSWLFLHRPDGWEAELDGLLGATGSAAAVDEAKALRKLAGAEARIAKLEADVAVAREELAAVRRARQAAGEQIQAAEAERDALKEEVARLKAALADTQARAKAVVAKPPPSAPPPPPPPAPPLPPEPTVDIAAVRQALTDALALLPEEPVAPPTTPTPTPRRAARRSEAGERSTPRRRAVPLPPGVFDDSAEAAEHLVRANGVIVLVDGYNATISAWPDLPLAEQRSRLVDALAELAARTGADATVVFDGAHEPSPAVRPARSPVKVRFSPPDVPADDVILDLVDAAPLHRPVVVASDDRAVQEGAAQRGANVISRAQLLSTLRRSAR